MVGELMGLLPNIYAHCGFKTSYCLVTEQFPRDSREPPRVVHLDLHGTCVLTGRITGFTGIITHKRIICVSSGVEDK